MISVPLKDNCASLVALCPYIRHKLHQLFFIQNELKSLRFVFSSIIFAKFAHKFKLSNMNKKKINRFKLVLLKKDKTGVCHTARLGFTPVTVSKWSGRLTS